MITPASCPAGRSCAAPGCPPRHVAEELAQVKAGMTAMEADDRPVVGITAADIRRMTGLVADRPATARARFGAVSRFFDWCQEEGHIDANPAAMVARSRRPKAVARAFTS